MSCYFVLCYLSGPSEPGEPGWSHPPPNICQTVVCFLYNSVLNEKEYNGQPPNMNFVPTALLVEVYVLFASKKWRSFGVGSLS